MPILNPDLIAKSLASLFVMSKKFFADKKIPFNELHLTCLDTLNKLAAMDSGLLSEQADEVLATLMESLVVVTEPSKEADYVDFIYQKIKAADQKRQNDQMALFGIVIFDRRPLYERINNPKEGQSIFLQLEDHDVNNLMPIPTESIKVFPVLNLSGNPEMDLININLIKNSFIEACEDPKVEHMMFAVGPGHWRGVYLTKLNPEATDETDAQQRYALELYDSFGPSSGKYELTPILEFLKKMGIDEKQLDITLTNVPENSRQKDGHTCGDFACAYSNLKMREWKAPLVNYRPNLAEVLANPYFENNVSFLRMISYFESQLPKYKKNKLETTDSTDKTSPQPTIAEARDTADIKRDFDKEKAIVLNLKRPSFAMLSNLVDPELEERAVKIQAILRQQQVVVEPVVVKPLVVKPVVVKPVVVKPLVVKPLVVKPLVVKPLVVKPLVVEPVVAEPVVVEPVVVEPISGKPSPAAPSSIQAEPANVRTLPVRDLSIQQSKFNILVSSLEQLSTQYASSLNKEVLDYPRFINQKVLNLKNSSQLFFETVNNNPENLAGLFELFRVECERICKDMDQHFQHDQSAWAQVKPILLGFVGILFAIAATLTTLGIATYYIASKESRREEFLDTFFRAEPKAVKEAKNTWDDYGFKQKLFGKSMEKEKSGVLTEIKETLDNNPQPTP